MRVRRSLIHISSGITRLQNQPGLALKGEGVLVGVIDTGVDYTNPLFRYSDGSSRILRIWDQTVQDLSLIHIYGALRAGSVRRIIDFVIVRTAGSHRAHRESKYQRCVYETVTLVDIAGGFQPVARPGFGMSKGGGEIPWYVHELPVIVIGCGQPFVLADIPQARTYINTYDSADQTFDALIEKLMSGSDAFIGEDPVDAYCGLWDTHR